ncbi:hypothetical protein C7974DRAFT_406417 [Boeremia exigua]|uniref:uncharacterized protein n=1 Tax=Boeremia exigua TaxID=749465 RepID=UPI001E8EA8D2|nr:uncharacterized protein C7974DRAFT_406417 [Boeremia exigua]KAH6611858.1 hypothetical protein C7974DRAFT_406417 [Boeremia exigua]
MVVGWSALGFLGFLDGGGVCSSVITGFWRWQRARRSGGGVGLGLCAGGLRGREWFLCGSGAWCDGVDGARVVSGTKRSRLDVAAAV